jgi:hypothetical protein
MMIEPKTIDVWAVFDSKGKLFISGPRRWAIIFAGQALMSATDYRACKNHSGSILAALKRNGASIVPATITIKDQP